MTGDGSHTIYVIGLKEHYHSIHGAVSESRHIFIGAGLQWMISGKSGIDIFEVGFGTGLNAFLTWEVSRQNNLKVNYCAIETFPLPSEIYRELNYAELAGAPERRMDFFSLHESPWNQWQQIDSQFSLLKVQADIQRFQPQPGSADLVYFDAFGPDVQPEMWTIHVFRKLFEALRPGGVLVTYSTKGEVKRNLKAVGFLIEKLPGPPGKREMLRAVKP